MEEKADQSNHARRNGTQARRKTIFLTDEGREKIQRFADTQHISFSSAIEALALFGLDEPAAVALAPMVTSVVTHAVEQPFARFARLLAYTAVEAGIAARMSTASTFWDIYSLALSDDDARLDQVLFAPDPDDQTQQRARRLLNRLKERARIDAVVRMRRPLELNGLQAAPTPAEEARDGDHSA